MPMTAAHLKTNAKIQNAFAPYVFATEDPHFRALTFSRIIVARPLWLAP